MAVAFLMGQIKATRVLPNNGGCMVTLHEFRKGFRKKNGDVVVDKWLEWKVLFRPSLVPYITEHFGRGMFVEIKGDIYPYAIDDDKTVDGYSFLGSSMNAANLPRPYQRQEQKAIKESQAHSSGTPDLDAYNQPDW